MTRRLALLVAGGIAIAAAPLIRPIGGGIALAVLGTDLIAASAVLAAIRYLEGRPDRRRTITNIVWLALGALLIATGINAAVHVSWFVSLLIAAAAVGCLCSVLLTFGTATYALTRSEPRAVAELHANIRKELPR